MTAPILNYRKLKNSAVPTWLGLVIGSWTGLLWGSLLTLPVGVGLGVAAGSLLGGFLAVPLWGTFWGLVGLNGQRQQAIRQYGVRVISEDSELTRRVGELAARLGLKRRPWVGVMPHSNAYAIGANANDAMVVIGEPLLHALTDDEIEAILGHELGHVANNDMRRMGLARSFQNALVWYLGFSKTLQRWARWMLVWVAELFLLRLSRHREYWADAIGAALTSKHHMISALEKLHAMPELSGFERQQARLMVRGIAGGSLFSTHPTFEQRRDALERETYLRRLPLLAKGDGVPPPATLPQAEDIAYARR